MIEHDMEFLFSLADTVSVIHWGQVIAAGDARRAPSRPWVKRANWGQAKMLEIDRIDTFYGETQALFGVSLAVGQGEAVALLGPNGAGKTTMLRSILGLTPARRGSHPLRRQRDHQKRHPRHRPARHRLGARRPANLSGAQGEEQPRARQRSARPSAAGPRKKCFELFPALEYLLDRESENLSGGEMQMVAIGARSARRPGPHSARRAVAGPRAEARAGRDEDHRPPQEREHRASWWSSRTCAACSRSAIASTSCTTAASSTRARRQRLLEDEATRTSLLGT